ICPVGALTSKPYRFVSRPWDLETAPSVCTHCSVGCPITNESRHGTMVRCQALPNEQVNDFWICDKGRFGYHHVSAEDRLDNPLVRSGEDFQTSGWGAALALVAEKLEGKSNVGVIAGGHLTTEDAYAISKLAKGVIGTKDVDSRIQDAGAPYASVARAFGVAGSTATMNDLRAAKTIVWIGPDPKETLPVLYLHLNTTVRDKRAKLLVASTRRISLHDLPSLSVSLDPSDASAQIKGLASEVEGKAVVCWAPSSPGRDESATLRAAIELAQATGARFLMCPPHAGSQGMIDMGVLPDLDAGYAAVEEPGRDTRAILEAATAGELDALLVFGADPIADFPDAGLARRALESGTFTVVVELFPTETALLADVVLPSIAYAERSGTFTNLERRLQKLEVLTVPPGTAREPWSTAQTIAKVLGDEWGWNGLDDVWDDIRANVPTHADVDLDRLTQEAPLPQPNVDATGFTSGDGANPLHLAGPGGQYPKGHRQGAPFQTGQNWPLSWELRAFEAKQRPGYVPPLIPESGSPGSAPAEASSTPTPSSPTPASSGAEFALFSGRMIYDEGTMISKSAALRAIQRKPFVELNDHDAKALGISDGDEVVVEGAGASLTLTARVDGVAKGTVFVPYDQVGAPANSLMSGVDPTVVVRKP
ncbi:MAG TPA: molybdopterin-dependent oxidoreductase, partial [Actinomycetota bacterium]|nr:molybdopterin-dependent oxidoreductase [Actinomycetota bacterium]